MCGEARLGEADGGLQQARPGQVAVALVRHPQALELQRDSHRQTAADRSTGAACVQRLQEATVSEKGAGGKEAEGTVWNAGSTHTDVHGLVGGSGGHLPGIDALSRAIGQPAGPW